LIRQLVFISSFTFLLASCQQEDEAAVPVPEPLLFIPAGFPSPEFPEDNPFSEPAWTLGRDLFYDVRLSKDESVSCASCHLPEYAFSDILPVSRGVENRPGTRNAPSLANVAYHPYFTREGGVPTLEMQVLVPVQEHNEFDFNILQIAERLSTDEAYQQLSAAAYGRELDYYVIPRALATFERSMISGNSKYDRHLNGGESLTPQEQMGMDLFFSDKTDCSSCHKGFNFTAYEFKNNGLYKEYADPGRYRLTGDDKDLALFKVPSLRNVGVTGPYMHDGSMTSLENVVDHYNTGGKDHIHKSDLIRPLNLSKAETQALVAFLETLTDHTFINNKKFRNED
jgi:cytochrome c peroxidase